MHVHFLDDIYDLISIYIWMQMGFGGGHTTDTRFDDYYSGATARYLLIYRVLSLDFACN